MRLRRRKFLTTGTASALIPFLAKRASAASSSSQLAGLSTFREKLRGRLILPNDKDYDGARRGKGTTPVDDRKPRLVVLVDGAEDIVRTLDFAHTNALELAVRSGGHDILGESTSNGGLQIDLARMNRIAIDPRQGLARVQTGSTSGPVIAAAQPYHLAPILGMSRVVGVGGVTLGGGIGWLCGRYGAACDHVLEAQIVTADGKVLRASANENADLFWAIRGGGGNFGVAAEFTYKLQPVGRVLAGNISFNADVKAFLRFYREFLAGSADELDTGAAISFGKTTEIHVALCWSGDLDKGEQALRPLRTFATPIADSIQPTEHADFVNATKPGMERTLNMFWRAGALAGISDAFIEKVVEIAAKSPPEGSVIGVLHHIHGALCAVDPNATPFIRTQGQILYNTLAFWEGTTHPRIKEEWVKSSYEEIRKVASTQTYVNYLSDGSEAAVRGTYGAHYEKLRALKLKYDPSNFFHGNRNIRPAQRA